LTCREMYVCYLSFSPPRFVPGILDFIKPITDLSQSLNQGLV
jgi:hypothetical protein